MKDLSNFDKAYFEISDRIECGYNPQHAIEEVTSQIEITDSEYEQLYNEFL